MYRTGVELWEAERRYQANSGQKIRGPGYLGPGFTSLGEEEVSLLPKSGSVKTDLSIKLKIYVMIES